MLYTHNHNHIIMTTINERTITLLYKNISLTLYSRKGDVSCVWEVSGDKVGLLFWPKVLLTIADLLSRLGWGCSTVGHWGPKALCLPLALNSASCPQLTPTPTDSSRLCPGYIFVWRTPASSVVPLIYTCASLDLWLGRGSICYKNEPGSNGYEGYTRSPDLQN